MLFYFIIFCIAGFAIGSILKDSKIAIAIIIVISFLWALVFGPWALAAFAELMLGYVVAKKVNHTGGNGDKKENEPHDQILSLRKNKATMTITTKASEVDFAIGGTGKMTIDWGDGTPKGKYVINDVESDTHYVLFSGDRLSHNYTKQSLHTISIVGKNVIYLNCGSEKTSKYYTQHCCDNQIVHLDVESNIALKSLKCVDNQLQQLIIGNNKSLAELDCRNNKLTHLDIHKNESLSYFYCCDNELETLDVKNNINLKLLYCSNNKLKALDISRNNLLKELDCSENELQILNTGTGNALSELDCSGNQLESLSVNGNSMLKSLHCPSNCLSRLDVSKNASLWNLNCRNNHLTSLDVSRNINLEVFDCCNNYLSTLDVSKNISLSKLYCDDNELESINVGENSNLTVDIDLNNLNAVEVDSETIDNLSDDEFLEFIESGRLPSSIKKGEKNIHQAQALEVIPRDDLIAEALAARNVEHIVHFTQASNIDSIIEYGLLPRNMLHLLPVPAACNDDLRLDSREDSLCLSIGFPNYPMFYKYRKIGEENGIEWAVIVLSKDVLIEKDCLFCHTNAARGSVRGLSENTLKGVGAFNALYEREPTRKELDLPDDWPTDAQAEVLIKGAIEPGYIRSIAFANKLLADEYKLKYPQLDIRNNSYFYNTRDYSLRWMQKWQ